MFAMPILDFNPHGLDKFWIYWAVTIPVTAFVMVVVFLLILPPEENRRSWERWQDGLTVRLSLPEAPPPLRLLLVLDHFYDLLGDS